MKIHASDLPIILASMLIALCAAFSASLVLSQPSGDDVADHADAMDVMVSDRVPPRYLCGDDPWSGIPYGDSTVGESGDLIACMAMLLSYIEDDDGITPITVLNEFGTDAVVSDADDVANFLHDASIGHGVEYSSAYTGFEDAYSRLENGWCLIARVHGSMHGDGGASKPRFIFIWRMDGEGIWIYDPHDAGHRFAVSEGKFESLHIEYFHALMR